MNREFLVLFLENTHFPDAAKEAILTAADQVSEQIAPILAIYEDEYNHEATIPHIQALAKTSGVHEYTLWTVLLSLAAEKARPFYTTEELYWNTFADLMYKALECFDIYGIWGTFVAHWYPIFYNGTIVKLGRMEYQVRKCSFKESKTVLGITINPGESILALHIPASGEPFDAASRLESYRMAWEYFCPDGKPLVCTCGSWLLYDKYEEVFAPNSNIANFRKDFYMLNSKESETFSNIWRVFGSDHNLSAQELPERTSLQRAFKRYILSGGTHGNGTGVIVFDGKKLLSASK